MESKADDVATAATWDARRVQGELPSVPALVGGRVAVCPVRGRLAPYALVLLPQGGQVEVAWETVAHCLNTGRPVLVS